MPRMTTTKLKRAIFHSRTVEPHSSVYGFSLFDVTDLPTLARGAPLCEGLQDAGGAS